ncbi:MAG: type II toxin-antitoxin system HicB family antitoxin [Magnetococcus sp. MYC-9]
MFAFVCISMYHTNHEHDGTDENFNGGWLGTDSGIREPPPFQTPEQSGCGDCAASEKGYPCGDAELDSQTCGIEMKNQDRVKIFFPVAIEPGNGQRAFGVVVPDLPGCFSVGDSLEEAIMNAREAILSHMACLSEEGIALPEQTSMAEHTANPDFAGWLWAVIDVDDVRETHPPMRVNITLPRGLLHSIDAHVQVHHMSRSGFLAAAARKALTADG